MALTTKPSLQQQRVTKRMPTETLKNYINVKPTPFDSDYPLH
jgi:hypothetical protein